MRPIQLPTIRLADKGALPTIRLAAILGMLATAVLLGVVSVTAGLGVAGWITGLVTGSAGAALLATAGRRSDQPAILPADWVTLTRTVVIAGVAQVRDTETALRDQRRFEQALRGSDPEASVPASDLLTGLRGKDVIIAFVESYGQVAVQGNSFSAGINAVLRQSTASLARVGWSTQSAWINAPGFGRGQPTCPLHPAVGAVGQHPPAVCRDCRQQPVHPQRRLRQGWLAHRQRQPL